MKLKKLPWWAWCLLAVGVIAACIAVYCIDRVPEPDLTIKKELPTLDDAQFIWEADTSVLGGEVSAYKNAKEDDITRRIINYLGFDEPRYLTGGTILENGDARLRINDDRSIDFKNEGAKGFLLTGEKLTEKCEEIMRCLELDPNDYIYNGEGSYSQTAGSQKLIGAVISFAFKGDTISTLRMSLRKLSPVLTASSRSIEDCEDYIRSDSNMYFFTDAPVTDVDEMKIKSAEIRYFAYFDMSYVQPLYYFSGTLTGSGDGEMVETTFEATIPALPDKNLRWTPYYALKDLYNAMFSLVDQPTPIE